MSSAKLVPFIAAAGLLIAACSSGNKSATAPPPAAPSVTAPASSAPVPAPAATPAAATSAATTGLSGSWSGHYGGAFQGTFSLTWQQSGSHLSGTIKISNPDSTVSLHGTVDGNAITFGTVGSTDITYSGTVAGSSMSGTYQVKAPNGSAGGPWSASKTS